MGTRVTKTQVQTIADLAHLTLTSEEQAAAEHYLNQILDYADRIAGVATDGVEPFFGVSATLKHLRADQPRPFDSNPLLAGPQFKDRLLVTKPVFTSYKDDR